MVGSKGGGHARSVGVRQARLILAVLVGGYLVASLFPFQLDSWHRVDNAAMRSGESIVFPAPGIVTFGNPPAALSPSLDAIELPLRFELEVEPAGQQSGPARILALSAGPESQSLVIGQSGDDLVVRVRRAGSTASGTPPIVVPGALAKDGSRRVAVEVGADDLTVAVAGTVVERVPADGIEGWDRRHRLVLGNEHGGRRPWLGRIDVATVSSPDEHLDLLALGDIPAHYWSLPDRLATSPPWYLAWDVGLVEVLHGLTMAGIAFLGVRAAPRRPAWVVLAACWTLSVVTLAAKFFVAWRHPAVGDLVVECIGAAIGVVAGRR